MEQWQQVEELFHAALAEPPDRRVRFVSDACPGNEQLRKDVLALIASAASADSFLEDSPLPVEQVPPAVLRPGQMVAGFEVVELIGAGGMGEVYRARDLRLRRDVAIKVLPDALQGHADRLTRFEREARAASALNHPGICTIYGFEDHGGRPVIVMELIEGETLAARLRKGPLPVDKALDLAIQLADALDAAHSKAIVHRDLKPANVMLTKSGIKVLDFGLAKLEETPAGKTLTQITEQGTIMGTLQYMSPEQVQGIESDTRTDIFSFGLVLYESFTGRPAFHASNRASLIGAILHTDPPPVRAMQPLAPLAMERIIQVCLAKTPDDRFQSARDLKRALEWVRESPKTLPEPALKRRANIIPWIAALALGCVAGMVGWLWPRPAKEAPVVNWTVAVQVTGLMALGTGARVQLSPDGSAILYTDQQGRLCLRHASSLDPILLRGTEGALQAFWSNDGGHIAFFASHNTKLMKMRIPDGVPEEVAEIQDPRGQRGGTWSPNGTLLFSSSEEPYFVSSAGGTPVKLEIPHLAGGSFLWPEFLPNGEDFLFTWAPSDDEEAELYVARLRNGKVVKGPVLLKGNATGGYFSPSGGGQLLFVKNDDLFAQRLDSRGWELLGEPRLVVRGVRSIPAFRRAEFSVSAGVLLWRPGKAALALVTWFDRKGNVAGVAGEPWLAKRLRLSPDERYLLAEFRNSTRLLEPNQPGYLKIRVPTPLWSSDGSRLLYPSRIPTGQVRLLQGSVNGDAGVEEIVRLPDVDDLDDISSDGRFLLYMSHFKLYYVRIDGGPDRGQPHLAVQTDEQVIQGRFSPDGRWIVYSSSPSQLARPEVFAQPFASSGIRTQIAEGALFPVWRGDGKEIVCLRDGQVLSARVAVVGGKLQATAPEILFEIPTPPGLILRDAPLAISRDGSRIVLLRAVDQPSSEVFDIATAWDRNWLR